MGLSTQTHSSGAVRAITPADGADFDDLGICRAIYVGGADYWWCNAGLREP